MFLSKIWFILIALFSAVAITFALVTPRPAVQKLAVLEGQRLDRAQYATEQMFKVDAHKWIDRVGKLGRDAILSESLDAASRGAGEYTVIHRTIQDRFRTLIPDLASGGIDVIAAVDNKGRVLARLGEDDKEYGDYIGGSEVIADALRGYLSDDVWGTGGKLQRVAAAPVLSKAHDRIVGAIYVGAETGAGLVERLKKNLDVDVALLLKGRVIASSRPPGELERLPELIADHTKEIESVKRTPALALDGGQDKLLVVAAPFPGQAGEQQAYYALIGIQPAKTDLWSLLAATTSDDLKWGHFPWLQLLAGMALMVGIGLLLQRIEVEAPLRKLRRELQRVAGGETQRIADRDFGGHFGGLARDVNAAIERFTHAPAPRAEGAAKDLGAILGPGPAGAVGNAFDLPAADSGFAAPTPPPASRFAPPPAPTFAPPTAATFGAPSAPTFAPPPPPRFEPPPPPDFPPPPPFSATVLGFGGSSSVAPTASHDGNGAGGDGEATRVVPYDAQDEEELHFQQVYNEFLDRKRECGESTAGLTRDKFVQKLRENKAALLAKHNCRTVRFSVYVKDGKAALKATPIRD